MDQQIYMQPEEERTNGPSFFARITESVVRIAAAPKPPRAWYIAFYLSVTLLLIFLGSVGWAVNKGIGVWGNTHPVVWGWPIVNFVFWIGIAHAGTLISAILLLLRQQWRTAINRFAEAMTVFAVLCASIFPIIHLGRPWFFYWMLPYPNQMGMWPQFRSPLTWDAFAVGTYAAVSVMFLYLGMIPDLATFRDQAKKSNHRFVYGLFALGWRGSSRQWCLYERAYLLLAGLATPLVISVHSIVAFDFSVSQLPGWHTTIFPPYFVCGAIFGGLAMLATLAIPARHYFGLKELIQIRHFDAISKIMLAMSILIGYAYGVELFFAWYNNSMFEGFTFLNRTLGPYAWAYWIILICNILAPQVFWFKEARTNLKVVLVVGILVTIGMWFERFVIICTSQSRDFLPANWGHFIPTTMDLLTFAGSFGLFFTLFLLFCRYLPMISIAEVKSVSPVVHAHGPLTPSQTTVWNPTSDVLAKNTGPVLSAPINENVNGNGIAGLVFFTCGVIGSIATIAAINLGKSIGDGFNRFMQSYFIAFVFVLSIALGALIWLILIHLVQSKWTSALRRIIENIASTMPAVALLFLPILVSLLNGKTDLFPWAVVDTQPKALFAQHKTFFLNVPFFFIRWLVYFSTWIAISWYMKKQSLLQDRTGDPQFTARMRRISGPAMILVAVTLTFASIDLLMSLTPDWSSSIIGVYYFAACVLAAIGTVVIALVLLQKSGRLLKIVTVDHYHDLGKMLFTFTMLWAYIGFSQFLIIWYANIPEETIWFQVRMNGDWAYLTAALIIGHFLMPFFGLLSRRARRHRLSLACWAVWIVLMNYMDIYWLIMPSLNPSRAPLHLLDLLCLLGVGGLFFASTAYVTRKDGILALQSTCL